MADTMAPYPSRHLAKCAMQQRYPTHSTHVAKGTESDAELVAKLRQKLGEAKRLSLEIAKLECDLKERIGFNSGLELPGGAGILLWTSTPSRRSAGKVSWMRLVHDMKITEETLDKYRQPVTGERRFRLRRKVHGPTADSLPPHTEEEEFDESNE